MGSFKIIVLGFICMSRLVLALTAQQISRDLQVSLSAGSSVLLPSNSQYAEEIAPRWDVYAPPTYVVAVKPTIIEDVQKVIRYASANKVPFLATGGGHGYTATLGELQNGLELDMGNFNTIDVNSKANLMTIGGSVKSASIIAALQTAGKEFPVGQCTCVGLTGFTLGGGIGPYSGLYGPASDSVSSIEMVTGTGEILTVSKTQNSDLFWGMKGAGFNYGVVTSLTYSVYDATNGGRAMNADMMFPGSKNGSVWTLARSFIGNQPKELSISLEISYNSTLEEVIIIANFVYAGLQEEGEKLIQPFLNLQPFNVNISTIAWKDIPSSALYGATVQGCSGTGVEYVPYSVNLYQIDVDNLIDVVNFMNSSFAASPELQTAVIAITQYAPGGFQRYADSSSAFPFRDVVIFAQIDCFVFDASDIPAFTQWGQEMRTLLQQGSGKKDLEVYINFAHGDEGEAAWYTESKLAQLQSLKAKYDPHSLFSFYNPVSSTSHSNSIQ